jgi:hypothetical protein
MLPSTFSSLQTTQQSAQSKVVNYTITRTTTKNSNAEVNSELAEYRACVSVLVLFIEGSDIIRNGMLVLNNLFKETCESSGTVCSCSSL